MASKRKSVNHGYYRGTRVYAEVTEDQIKKVFSREDELQEKIKRAAKEKEYKRKARINYYLDKKIAEEPTVTSLVQEYKLILSEIKNLKVKKYRKTPIDKNNFYLKNFQELVNIQKEIFPRSPYDRYYGYEWENRMQNQIKKYATNDRIIIHDPKEVEEHDKFFIKRKELYSTALELKRRIVVIKKELKDNYLKDPELIEKIELEIKTKKAIKILKRSCNK